MPETKFVCPACRGEILVQDTMVSGLRDFASTSYRYRIETQYLHVSPVMPECAEFIQAFAAEQKSIISKTFRRMVPEMNWDQPNSQ